MKKPEKSYTIFVTLMLGIFFTLLLHEPVLNPDPTAAEQILNWIGCGVVGFCVGYFGSFIFYYLTVLCLTFPIVLLHAIFDR